MYDVVKVGKKKVYFTVCAKCGKRFELKPKFEQGEEPVYDAERRLWFCSWDCYAAFRR